MDCKPKTRTQLLEVEFTHGICPDCMKTLYPEYYYKKGK